MTTADFKTRIRLPESRLQFDEELFLRLLAACISITKEDKRRVILGLPKLSQGQVDELMEIMADEVADIERTAWEWPEGLKRLQARQERWWRELERELSN